MKYIKKYWPVIFFLVITVIYSFPYFFGGKIPFPSSYVANNLAPWNKYLPHGPIKNGIPDVAGEIFPMRSLVVDFWKNGIVPLWNPYVFSGTPLLANFQSAVFSPMNLLFGIFSKADAWSILVLLQPLLAALFTFLFCQSLRLSKTASLFSSLSFMFCGYLTVWGSYATMGYTILYLPLVLFLVEKYLQNKKTILLPLIPLVLAISFFSGHIQTWTYVFLATVIYFLVRFFSCEYKRYKNYNNYKTLLFLGISVFLTLPLVAIQLFPTWEFYQLSGRSLARNAGSGIPFSYLITLLAPDFFGNPVTRNDWFGIYAEWSGYTGLVALLLSVFAIAISDKKKKIWPFLAIGIAGILLSVQNPLLSLLSSLPIPIFSNSNPSRAVVLLSFAIAMLSGFGAEELLKDDKKTLNKFLGLLTVVSIIFITIIIFILFGKNFFSADVANSLRLISLKNLILPLGFMLIVWILMIGLWLKPQFKKIIVICLLLTVVFEMLRFYTKWTPFDDKNSFYAQTGVTDFLQKQKGYYRYYGQLNQSAAYLNHVFATDGYEPLNLLSYSELLSGAPDGKLYHDYKLEVKLQSQEKYTPRLLGILGVGYLIYGADDIRNPFVFPFWKYGAQNYPQLFTDGKYTVFANNSIVKRPQLFSQYQVITNKEKALQTLLSDGFDYNKVLILGSDPGLSGQLGSGSAVIKQYGANKIEMSVSAHKPSLLFLSDNYYPGWQAYVNGRKTEIILADFTFRAVAVPAGNSLVVMNYEPNSFKNGAIISGTTLVLLILLIIFL